MIDFIIAITNAWGIFLIIFLNGFGLVSIPKKVFNYTNREQRLKRLEYQASQLSDEREDFEEVLKECSGKLKSIKNKLIFDEDAHLSTKVDIMWECLSQVDERFRAYEPNKEHVEYAKNLKKEKLSSLNKKLKKACHEFVRTNK